MAPRNDYLNKLIEKRENGLIKVITGIRRCGKSYLLFNLYDAWLREQGIQNDQIIRLALDDDEAIRYRNPIELGKYLRSLTADAKKQYYIFLDEIQKVASIPNPYLPQTEEKVTFVDVLLGLMKHSNIDVYVTGSNSKMLSSDILTEFRGRGDEIKVYPFSFKEYLIASGDNTSVAFQDFFTFGGMPFILSRYSPESKSRYLHDLFDKIYIDDIMARHNLSKKRTPLDDLLDVLSSSIGSLTNPQKLANTFKTNKIADICDDTIAEYIEYFIDAFMLEKAKRYNIKGRKYIGSPQKYYFTDIGLRNARLNFRQQEPTHIMENIIYNELCIRGYDVDVGIVERNIKSSDGKSQRLMNEVDFVANKGEQRIYIQSAFAIPDEEKRAQETESLRNIKDSFPKIVILGNKIRPWHDEYGILYIGIEDFLLNDIRNL